MLPACNPGCWMARGLAQHGGWCGLQQVHLIPGLTIFCSLTLSVVYLDSKPTDHTICCLSCLLPATRQRLPLPSAGEVGTAVWHVLQRRQISFKERLDRLAERDDLSVVWFRTRSPAVHESRPSAFGLIGGLFAGRAKQVLRRSRGSPRHFGRRFSTLNNTQMQSLVAESSRRSSGPSAVDVRHTIIDLDAFRRELGLTPDPAAEQAERDRDDVYERRMEEVLGSRSEQEVEEEDDAELGEGGGESGSTRGEDSDDLEILDEPMG
ncbi:BQ5605_C004g03104 [Microbotryum silenes-dioicae]|uniref:BQ5605_C004g03104 protein n=1 Tax=Microbotryum silenes-dioicae TaxID=796604 RepID=A0A2X0N3S9_9BASI|nr:BQ5605_C004g03104 [Microbotryum silenes-dioicae]